MAKKEPDFIYTQRQIAEAVAVYYNLSGDVYFEFVTIRNRDGYGVRLYVYKEQGEEG